MAKTNTAETSEKPDGGDAPLIDLNEASLKKLIARAKKRGYITVDELNAGVGEMSTDQIEDVMSALSEMGINVVENEEADEDEAAEPDLEAGLDDGSDGGGEGERFVVEKKKETVDRTDDPVRMYLREMGAV
ncbi:MAG TPA: RNA polymerase sigma factor region1.1 domain-containing protein, partial [Allosphingosinicella sp.]